MREQLIQYVQLLFAGAADCEDIQQEILQNTLDRYDDLVAQGKVPEAAYRLAIAGIGDINEILGTPSQAAPVRAAAVTNTDENDTPRKKLLRAIAVGLYILCAIPVIVLGEMDMEVLGLCGTLAIAAVATVLIMLGAKKDPSEGKEEKADMPKSQLCKSLSSVIWAVGLGVYFVLSFSTNDWHITWTIFPVLAALDALTTAIVGMYEAQHSSGILPDKQKIRKSIKQLIWAVGLVIYFIFSFATNAWYMTWLVFPVIGAIQGLTMAIMDLKEVMEHET